MTSREREIQKALDQAREEALQRAIELGITFLGLPCCALRLPIGDLLPLPCCALRLPLGAPPPVAPAP